MVNLNPQDASHPTAQIGLNQAFNPASKTAYECSASQQPNSQARVGQRTKDGVRLMHDDVQQPWGMGASNVSSFNRREMPASSHALNYSYQSKADLGGIKMLAPTEGKPAQPVESGGGGGNEDNPVVGEDLADTKKEQDEELKARGMKTSQEIEQEEKDDWTGKKSDVNVGEALAGRGSKVVLAAEN